MAAAHWPDTLPTGFETRGFSYGLKPTAAVTQPEVGRVRTRRRSTAEIYLVAGTMILQRDLNGVDQVAAFLTFLNGTLAGGSLPFDWVDPVFPPATFRTEDYDHGDANAEFNVIASDLGRAVSSIPVIANKGVRLALRLEMVRT